MDTKKYIDLINDIAVRYNVESMYVFGSRTEEIKFLIEMKLKKISYSDSDLDIGVHYIYDANPSVDQKVALMQELESLFNIPRVDIVDFSDADAFLALSIIEGELIYCRDAFEQAEFELYILRRAGDLAYYERERRRNILGGQL
jgi:predicted nucleotidyltransferase